MLLLFPDTLLTFLTLLDQQLVAFVEDQYTVNQSPAVALDGALTDTVGGGVDCVTLMLSVSLPVPPGPVQVTVMFREPEVL